MNNWNANSKLHVKLVALVTLATRDPRGLKANGYVCPLCGVFLIRSNSLGTQTDGSRRRHRNRGEGGGY